MKQTKRKNSKIFFKKLDMGRKKHFFLWKTKKGNKGKTYEMVYAFKN